MQPRIVLQGFLLGYDAASGEQLWSKQLDGPPSLFGTTVLNSVIYLSTNRAGQNRGNRVYAFSPKDGPLTWRIQVTKPSGTSFPWGPDQVWISNAYADQPLSPSDPPS